MTSQARSAQTLAAVCSLYIDMTGDQAAIAAGDWIVTNAGSRYLVASARRVTPRRRAQNAQVIRWQMIVHRLAKHCDIPDDVRAITLRWYRR